MATDQKVGGSNPLTHAITSGNQGFQRLFFCLDKVISDLLVIFIRGLNIEGAAESSVFDDFTAPSFNLIRQ